MASVRRPRGVALAALVGAFVIVLGVGVAALDAQARSDAATAAVTISAEQAEDIRDGGWTDFDIISLRQWVIAENLVSAGPMPTLTIEENPDGSAAYLSWGPVGGGLRPGSLGGWQFKPVALLPAAGLAMVIGSGFVAAVRWRPRHPFSEATSEQDRVSN